MTVSQNEERAGSRRAERPGKGRKVAVIEDDASTAALLSTLLQLEGYIAESFDNTPEIGALMSDANVDFVLCDDNMPGLRGPEVIALLRDEAALAGLPIVLMSGMYLEESEWRSTQADGFLLKPFNRQELLEALRSVERED